MNKISPYAGMTKGKQVEENTQTNPEIPAQEQAPVENISLSDAMTGVITEPRVTFESVKASTKRSYWVVPMIFFIVLSLVSTFLVMNDSELYSEIKAKQKEVMTERMEKAVKEGKMTQEQMNEAMERTDKMFSKSSPLFYVFTTVGPVMTILLALFVKGLVLWGVLKPFKGAASYMLVICVLGLASIIDSIQAVIDTVLAIFMGKLNANIGPALLFTKEAVGTTVMTLLSHFDVFNIWYLIVLGIGLAKISGLKSGQTVPVVFGLWLIWVCATTFLALPFMR